MKRPLLITDCDEVLLHMVSHFAEWLEVEHDVRFALETGRFTDAMTRVSTGETLDMDQGWILLEAFFRGEMHRQTLVPGAVEALGRSPRWRTSSSSRTSAARRIPGVWSSSRATGYAMTSFAIAAARAHR